jgi:hypothetical protein
MTTITTRSGKGSALSFAEVDGNFTNLNTDKIEGVTSSVDSEIALWSSTTGKVLKRADLTGIVKATAGVATTATAGTDYLAPPSGTSILKANSGGALANASAGTDYAGIDTDQTFTGSQRGAVTTDNDGSFDMNAGNNFSCTPTGTITLTFTNITAGQSGYVTLVNGSNYTISKASAVKVASGVLTALSATGTYQLSYFSPDGTNVYLTASGALS